MYLVKVQVSIILLKLSFCAKFISEIICSYYYSCFLQKTTALSLQKTLSFSLLLVEDCMMEWQM